MTTATGRILCPVHQIPDCSPLLNGCDRPNELARKVALATPPTTRDEQVEYLASVMQQGRLIGADWVTIAGRIIDTDLPGMSSTRPDPEASAVHAVLDEHRCGASAERAFRRALTAEQEATRLTALLTERDATIRSQGEAIGVARSVLHGMRDQIASLSAALDAGQTDGGGA